MSSYPTCRECEADLTSSEEEEQELCFECQRTPEKVVCNQCGATYTDPESIELAKKWIADGYAPCPNISCRGQLELKQ